MTLSRINRIDTQRVIKLIGIIGFCSLFALLMVNYLIGRIRIIFGILVSDGSMDET